VKQNELKKVYIGGAILKSFFLNTPNLYENAAVVKVKYLLKDE